MSLINAIILKARYKVLFDSFRKQVESSTLLSFLVISLIHFFLVKRNLQKTVTVVFRVLHGMKVKRNLLRRKKFSLCKKACFIFSSMLVIGVLYNVKVKCNFMRHKNKYLRVHRKFFLPRKKSHFIFFHKTG